MKAKALEKQARDINSMQGPLATKMSIKDVSMLGVKINKAVEELQLQNGTKDKIVNTQEENINRSLFSEATKEKYTGEER